MKRMINVVVFIASLIFVSAFFCSCADEEQTAEMIDWSLYTIVTPVEGAGVYSGSSGTGIYSSKGKMQELSEKFIELTGESPSYNSELDDRVEYEIIIGDCDIQEYKDVIATLRYNDYVISYDGKKFIIAAHTVKARSAAVSKFITLMPDITVDTQPGILAQMSGTYKAENIILNGTDIREYTLVYSSTLSYSSELKEIAGYYETGSGGVLLSTVGGSGAVNIFEYYIVQYCGYKLKIISRAEYIRNTEKYPHAILFGDCGGISSGLEPLGENEYEIISDGNNIAVAAAAVTQSVSTALGEILAEKYFGSAGMSNGVINVTIPEGKITGLLD